MAEFRIAAAQVPATRGDLARNITTHVNAIEAAARNNVSVLIFPELSLIGYEPDLSTKLAMSPADERLAPVADASRRKRVYASAGAPLPNGAAKPFLGAILFSPDMVPRSYAKMHLGGTEFSHFSAGADPLAFTVADEIIGLSICADSSQPSHPQTYAAKQATIYAAGVFLNAEWHASDAPRLAAYSSQFGMLVVMANHGASVGTHTSVGRSAIWGPDGTLLAEAEGTASALVIATRTSQKWVAEVALL
jgi:predicted amidohydrolase